MTEVERTERFPVDPDGLWDALTDPDLLREWFAPADDATVDVDLQPGGTLRFGEGEDARTAVVEEVEPGHRLTFTWDDGDGVAATRVEIDVTEIEGGSELHVRELLLEDIEIDIDIDIGDPVDVEVAPAPFPIGFQPPRALARA